jgi:hypothetical protein
MGKHQLRDNKGRFLSKEKSETIKFIALQNGVQEEKAQDFLNQNYNDVKSYIDNTEFDVRFNDKNYIQQMSKYDKHYINGKKVSIKQANFELAKAVNYMQGTLGMTQIVFMAKAKDQSMKTLKNIRMDITIPVFKENDNEANLELLEKMREDGEIIYYL